MKVISPSIEVLEDLDSRSMASRIEVCGRICYKSEDKITEESAGPFIKNIIKRGHNSVSEMAALTIRVTVDNESIAARFFSTLPKYLIIDRLEKKTLLISGTVRAFRELFQNHPTDKMVKAISSFLGKKYPLFYFDLTPKSGWLAIEGVRVEKLSIAEVDGLSAELLARHRYIGAKIITNRAVTHEIVRHRPCSYLQESQRYCRYDKDQFGNEVTFIRPMFFREGSSEYKLWEQAMIETERIYLKLLETSSPQAARTVLPNSCKTEIIVYANLMEWFHIFKLRTSKAAEPSMREIMIPLLDRMKEKFPSVFGDFRLEV